MSEEEKNKEKTNYKSFKVKEQDLAHFESRLEKRCRRLYREFNEIFK